MGHHTLKFYSINQELILRIYMLGAKLAKIPVAGRVVKAIMEWYARNQHSAWILTREEAKELIDRATSIAVGDCKCRKVFKNCDNPLKTDIVLGIGYDVFMEVRKGEYREISKLEAKKIIDECSERGLVHTIVKCQDNFYAICNCCSCCCVPLRLRREYGVKNVWKRDKDILNKFLSSKL